MSTYTYSDYLYGFCVRNTHWMCLWIVLYCIVSKLYSWTIRFTYELSLFGHMNRKVWLFKGHTFFEQKWLNVTSDLPCPNCQNLQLMPSSLCVLVLPSNYSYGVYRSRFDRYSLCTFPSPQGSRIVVLRRGDPPSWVRLLLFLMCMCSNTQDSRSSWITNNAPECPGRLNFAATATCLRWSYMKMQTEWMGLIRYKL